MEDPDYEIVMKFLKRHRYEIVQKNKFTIVLVGAPGVGKTAFLERHRTGKFLVNHEPTRGVTTQTVKFTSSAGPIEFQVTELGGQESHLGLGLCPNPDAVILMVSGTDKLSQWYGVIYLLPAVERHFLGVPHCTVVNKVDRKEYEQVYGTRVIEISAKSNYNFEKPWVYLARILTGDMSLHFIDRQSSPDSRLDRYPEEPDV